MLVGGGHAHLGVLESMVRSPWPRGEVILVSSHPHHHYSGMVPGFLEGRYREEELRFDLAALCRGAGVRFVHGTARRIRLGAQQRDSPTEPAGHVDLDEASLPFDVASLDVGSTTGLRSVAGAEEHAAGLRPMGRAVELRKRIDARIRAGEEGDAVSVVIVGAGAGGFEVALTLHQRIGDAGRTPRVLLLEAESRILPEYSDRVRRRARHVLIRRGVEVRTDSPVVAVSDDGVAVADGSFLPSQVTVWLAGAAPPPVLAPSDLPRSEDGFFQVDAALRAVDGAPVWGAGDCIALERHPEMPRAGVYAVRQAPILAANLRRALAGAGSGPDRDEGMERYEPNPSFLSIMNTGGGRGLLRWKGVVSHSRWAWWLKDRIDRRFMQRYQRLEGG